MAVEITLEDLRSCFHLPSEQACLKLDIGLTMLKRQCRRFGIKRWPFRKMASIDRLISNVQQGVSPGSQNYALLKSVEELEAEKRRMARPSPAPHPPRAARPCPAAAVRSACVAARHHAAQARRCAPPAGFCPRFSARLQEEGTSYELEDTTKRLQQAYSKVWSHGPQAPLVSAAARRRRSWAERGFMQDPRAAALRPLDAL